MSHDLVSTPLVTALAGHGKLCSTGSMNYGPRGDYRATYQLFNVNGRALVALSSDERGTHHLARYIDLLAPGLARTLNLPLDRTLWVEHDERTGTLAVVDMEWSGPDNVKPRWRTFKNGAHHYYAGSDYVSDLLNEIAQLALPPAPPPRATDAVDFIDVEVRT